MVCEQPVWRVSSAGGLFGDNAYFMERSDGNEDDSYETQNRPKSTGHAKGRPACEGQSVRQVDERLHWPLEPHVRADFQASDGKGSPTGQRRDVHLLHLRPGV